MSGGDFQKTGFVFHFPRKLKFLAYRTSFSLGHLFSAFSSNLVQMRKSLLRLITNTLPHFKWLQGSVLLIHMNYGKDTVGSTLIIITDTFTFHGIQTHVIVHGISLYVPSLPHSWPGIITAGPLYSYETFRTRIIFLNWAHTALEQNDKTGDPFIQCYFLWQSVSGHSLECQHQILALAPSVDIIQRENNLRWKQKS